MKVWVEKAFIERAAMMGAKIDTEKEDISIRLTASDNGMVSALAANSGSFFSEESPSIVHASGDIRIRQSVLSRVAAYMPHNEVSLEAQGGSVMFTSGSAVLSVPSLSTGATYKLIEPVRPIMFDMDKGDLLSAIKVVALAKGRDSRPAFRDIFIDIRDNVINFTANTKAFMVKASYPVSSDRVFVDSVSGAVRKVVLPAIDAFLSQASGGVKVGFSGGKLFLLNGGMSLYFKVSESEGFDSTRVLSMRPTVSMTLKASTLTAILRRMRILSDMENRRMDIVADGGIATFSLLNPIAGSVRELVSVDKTLSFDISLDPNVLMSLLSVFKDRAVVFIENNKPVFMVDPDNENKICVLAPMSR